MSAQPDEPHALIGNTRTSAWITPRGTLAWAAFPHADDPPVFDGLAPAGPRVPLDSGVFELEPLGPYTATRQFVGDTAVLQTLYEAADGAKASVLDFLPLRPTDRPDVPRVPVNRVVRVVEGHAGAMRFHLRFAPRPDGTRDGAIALDPNGLVASGSARSVLLQTEATVTMHPHEATGDFVLEPGEKRHFLLTVLDDPDPDVPEARATEADWELDGTFDFWLGWSRACPFLGVQRGHVLALAAQLKAIAVPPGHRGGHGPRLGDGATAMLGPLALAAWGWEDELARALAAWQPDADAAGDRAQAAWLFEGLSIARATGLVELACLLPHWARLVRMADALARVCVSPESASDDRLVAWVGLRAAVQLAEDLLLEGDRAGWHGALALATASLRAAGTSGPLAEAVGFVPASGGAPEGPEAHATAIAACWEVRRELAHGAYLQARRLMDRLLQAFGPLGTWPGARHADPAELALVLWTAAEVYLQSAPRPARVELPEDLGD